MNEEPAFVIAGHGRSGTKYMALLMGHFGYAVLHEKAGRDGVSAMDALVGGGKHSVTHKDGRFLFKERPWTKTIHVVRNPWQVIQSDFGAIGTYGVANAVAGWYEEVAGSRGIERVIRSVVVVNTKIAEFASDLVMRVEESPVVVEKWLREYGLWKGTSGQLPSTMVGHKDQRMIDEADYGGASEEAMDMLKTHCRKYGYPDNHCCGSCGKPL